jgi:Fe-S-cluster containining protein
MDKDSLKSGAVCLKHGCSLCCWETEMPLTKLDINRIMKLGYKISDFAVKSDIGWRLKNVDGRCFFLEGGKCKIYRFRPCGCRFYPLIYCWDKHKIILDDLCPHKMEFKIRGEDVKALLNIVKSLIA